LIESKKHLFPVALAAEPNFQAKSLSFLDDAVGVKTGQYANIQSAQWDKGAIVYHPPTPQIVINADGTITERFLESIQPYQAGQISGNGNTYTLTDDINGSQVQIGCSNIVFDGNGHSISLMEGAFNAGVYAANSINITIKNVKIFTPFVSVEIDGCSYCQITNVNASSYIELRYSSNNTISKNACPLRIKSGVGNEVFMNNLTDLSLWTGPNVIYANNIFTGSPYLAAGNVWDNGSVGNYWSDYLTRYPNASEIGQTGVGDTPYEIDADNVDYHPFMHPYEIEKDAVALPTPEATPTPEPEPFPTTLVITASGASAAIISIGVLMYLKKRNH
jgi:hypothetical protein